MSAIFYNGNANVHSGLTITPCLALQHQDTSPINWNQKSHQNLSIRIISNIFNSEIESLCAIFANYLLHYCTCLAKKWIKNFFMETIYESQNYPPLQNKGLVRQYNNINLKFWNQILNSLRFFRTLKSISKTF